VRKLLALNAGTPADAPRVEVVLLSRNSSDTGLRIFNSIEHHGLQIARAVFTSGEPTTPYIQPFGAQLFLSANPDSVRRALRDGVAAATILPAKAAAHVHDQLRIAFDGDAVIFGDESGRVLPSRGGISPPSQHSGNEAVRARNADRLSSGGPTFPGLPRPAHLCTG
jgi:5'-nucleotidase